MMKVFEFIFFRIGKDVVLRFVKECHRCPVITMDPKTADIDDSNIEKLKGYRLMKHGLGGMQSSLSKWPFRLQPLTTINACG